MTITASRTPELRIGGVVRCSACDWPGHLVATIFCQGCAWRCRYCQNPDLISAKGDGAFHWPEIRNFLTRRQNLLDGVVFSGGEPSLQAALPSVMTETKSLGMKIGLHTSGAAPARLAALWPQLDWVGFDVKAPFEHYAPTTGIDAGKDVQESLHALLASGTPYEVRTTIHPLLLPADQLEKLGHQLADMGVKHWVLQPFRSIGCQDRELVENNTPPPSVSARLQSRFQSFTLRAA